MADVNANIHIGIDASSAVAQLRALQTQISNFNRSVAAGNAAAAASQAQMASSLASMVGATGQFNTSIRTMESGVASLGTAFDKGTLSARQYFRYAASQMPGLTRAFRSLGVEQAQMADLATDRVKRLQTQYVSLGKDVRGMQKVMAITPKNLATGYATDLALAQQRQQLFNRSLQLGSTGLVNWGKNTQWAGRQLMVGFTIPLTIAAGAAAKFFMELDKASMQFRRVYGDLNTSTEETYRNLEAIKALGVEYTKYGTAVKDVIDIGARVAATGAQNQDLIAGTEQTLRLATLGQMEYANALGAVTSLQTAFSISAEELGNKINFLNAVENQTVLTMEDMAAAIPRVAPVIKGLGGDVEDLAVFMTALREGGVSAEQGANALKSGLASLINPTTRAQETLQALGININAIVQANKGDLMGTVKAFGQALNSLGEFERQQALETLFGKYQYARLGALFKNIANDASQSARAMDLAGASVEELRNMAEKELSIVSETVTNQFLGAIERLKVAIAPIGEMFLKVMTPIVDAVSAIANAFNKLPDGVKTAIGAVVAVVGGLAPVFLMGIGLIGNAIGNGLKTILALRNGVKGLAATLTGSGKDFAYQSTAALDAAAAMTSLEGKVTGLTGDLLIQRSAVAALAGVYRDLAAAAAGAAAAMPTAFPMPGTGGRVRTGATGVRPPTIVTQGFNRGGIVPGRGNSDTIPALLTPGESVVTKEATARFGPVIAAMNAGTLPGFALGQLNIGGPTPFASEFVPIERKSIRVEAAMQKVIDDLFVRHLKSAGGDITQIIGGIRTAVRQLAETGQSLTTPALVQRLKELGMYARMEGPLVFAHAQPQITLSPEEQTRMRQDFPRAQSAERMYGLGNFGFMMPEDFNKELMTGRQAATFFTDPAFVDRTMYPMYRAIADQLGRDPADVMRDPAIQRDVRAFANNIATNLTSGVMATSLIKEGDFYDISQRALSQTQMSETSRAGIESSKRMTTLAVFGGDPENRGTKGSRLGLPGRGSYKNWGLGDVMSSLFGGVRRRMGANSPATEGTRAVNDFAAGMEAGSAQAEKRAGNIGTRIGGALVSSVTATVSGPQGRPSPIPQRTAEILRALPGAQPNRSQNLSFGSIGGGPRVPTIGVSGAGFIPDGEGEGRPGRFSRIASRLGGRGTAMGAGMGLSMASMLPFMMQDQQGKFMGMDANIAGMGMMGGGALLSMIGMVPGPLLAVGAAAAAAGVALAAWRNSVDNSSRAAAEFGANIGGASNALTNMANMMGKATPTQQLTQLQLGVTEEQAAAFGEFQGMMNTEAGQAFVQKLEAATSADRFSMLGDYVAAAIASGMMDVTTGQAFAKAIAGSLNDPVLGNAVSRAISQQESGAKAMLSLAEKRLAAVQETAVIQSLQGTGPGPTGGTGVGRAGALMGYEQASQAIGSSIQIIKDFAEAAAMAELEYKNGTISFAEYQNIIGQNAQVQEQYANYMRKAISLSTDTGGVMQALKAQMQGLGVTEEQFGAIEEALSISQSDLRDAGVSAADAVKASGLRLSDAVAAVASGMNPADVAAILTFTQDLSTAAGQYYAQNMGEQGAIQTAGFIQAAETGLIAGVPEESRQRVIDLAVNFTGNVADLQAFLAAVPEEKVMTVVTKLQSISPEQQQIYIKSVQRLSSLVGQEAATAITESPEYQAALEKARGEALSTKGTRRGPSSQKDLKEIEDAVQGAADAGVFSDLESVVTFVLNEEPSDITERLPELTKYAEDLNENVPPEILKMLKIDIDNPEDLDKYGPMAEDLGKLVPILQKVPDVAKTMAVGLMFRKNGKVSTVDEYAKDANKLIKFTKNLESSDLEVKKTTIVQMLQEFAGPNGQQISEDQALNMFDELVSRYGEQKIMNLPPDSIFQLIQLRSQITGVRESIAMLEAVQNLGPEEARALEERRQKLAALLSFESDVVVTGGVGTGGSAGGGGGGGGGGGEGEKDPFQVMMDDLKLQKKFVGDIIKGQDGLKSGFAQALRNAGAPEFLIAEIISKGEDGLKIAKKLLQDKQKKLKELMKLSFDVARLTFIESQRAQANNLRAQAAAQSALVRTGVDASVAMDISPEDAEMVNAAYQRVQQARKAVRDAEGKDRKKAKKELQDATKEWQQLTGSIKNTTRAQEKFNDEQAQLSLKAGVKEQRQVLSRQAAALTRLMTQGFTFEQAQEFAGDDTFARAITSAGRAADAANQKYNALNEQLKAMGPRTKKNAKEWDALNKKVQKAGDESDILSKKYKSLIIDLQKLTKEQKANLVTNTKAEYEGLTNQLGNQLSILQKLVDGGMSYAQAVEIASDPQKALAFQAALDEGVTSFDELIARAQAFEAATAKFSIFVKLQEFNDAAKKRGFLSQVTALTAGNQFGGMVTDYLMGLSTAELQEFFNQTPEWRQQFVSAFLDSIPLAEKVSYLFNQISAAQKYQSLLNKDKANKDKGNIDSLNDQLKAQQKLLKIEQDKLKAIQKTVDVIQEENDDLNRGLDLISRQEEKINEAFDKRIEALDKVEQANARIAQQQQNQLSLSQALSTGDIYAATQAAQQIRQDNATAAIENTREALETAREEQLKNLVIEVNGQLLTREQIEKRIEANNDRIYQIQEDQIEPIERVIDGIQDQIDKVETLKDAWQDYYDSLEKNAVDPLTGMKYSELEKIKAYYDALIGKGMEAGAAFNQAMADYVAGGGKITDETRLRGFFGISATPPAATNPAATNVSGTVTGAGGTTTQDVNAANEAAIKALPSVTAVLNVAKQIWPQINFWEDAILAFSGAVKDTAQPVIETVATKAGGILRKFKDAFNYINDEFVPNSLTPLETFIKDNLLAAVQGIVDKFIAVNAQVVAVMMNIGGITNALNAMPKDIVVNIVVNTTYTSSGQSSSGKGKFMGGLIKYATGGTIPGGIPRDSIPILASPGEFVVRNSMVDKYGIPMLNDINQGSFNPRFKTPSSVSYNNVKRTNEITNSPTMYNNTYTINVSAQTNASADEIATRAAMKIREIDSMRIRSARG